MKTGFAIHLMEPHLSKAEGLAVALEKMGLKPSEILAVGDAPNDISLFEFVGHSVAVGGCFEELAAIANVVSTRQRGDRIITLVDAIIN